MQTEMMLHTCTCIGGKTPYGDVSKEAESIAVSYKPNTDQRHHAKPISFEDYQSFWKGIATSIADEDGSTGKSCYLMNLSLMIL